MTRQHLLEHVSEVGHYQLPAIVADFAQYHFDESLLQANSNTLQALHSRAAQYYFALIRPYSGQQQRHNKDVQMLIEAVWHKLQAGQKQEAYDIIQQEDILQYIFEI